MTVPARTNSTQRGAHDNHRQAFTSFAVRVVGLAVAVVIAGAVVAASSLVEVVVGVAIALCASLVGALPLRKVTSPEGASSVVPSVLAAMGLRLAVAVGLGLIAALSGVLEIAPLLVALACAHLVLLVADTGYARALAERAAKIMALSPVVATNSSLPTGQATSLSNTSKVEEG